MRGLTICQILVSIPVNQEVISSAGWWTEAGFPHIPADSQCALTSGRPGLVYEHMMLRDDGQHLQSVDSRRDLIHVHSLCRME